MTLWDTPPDPHPPTPAPSLQSFLVVRLSRSDLVYSAYTRPISLYHISNSCFTSLDMRTLKIGEGSLMSSLPLNTWTQWHRANVVGGWPCCDSVLRHKLSLLRQITSKKRSGNFKSMAWLQRPPIKFMMNDGFPTEKPNSRRNLNAPLASQFTAVVQRCRGILSLSY